LEEEEEEEERQVKSQRFIERYGIKYYPVKLLHFQITPTSLTLY